MLNRKKGNNEEISIIYFYIYKHLTYIHKHNIWKVIIINYTAY